MAAMAIVGRYFLLFLCRRCGRDHCRVPDFFTEYLACTEHSTSPATTRPCGLRGDLGQTVEGRLPHVTPIHASVVWHDRGAVCSRFPRAIRAVLVSRRRGSNSALTRGALYVLLPLAAGLVGYSRCALCHEDTVPRGSPVATPATGHVGLPPELCHVRVPFARWGVAIERTDAPQPAAIERMDYSNAPLTPCAIHPT